MKRGDLVQFKTYRNGALGILLCKTDFYKKFHFDNWMVAVFPSFDFIEAYEDIDFCLSQEGK